MRTYLRPDMILLRLVITAFFVGHGLVHAIMFGLSYSPKAISDMGFNPAHSWLIGETRAFGFAFSLVVSLAFIVAGCAYLGRADWWPQLTIAAAVLSLLLLLLYFSKWWLVGYPISIAFAIAAWQSLEVK
jgi:hypothetical protein